LQIDPKTPIAGLRPAVLKRVFRRGEFHIETFAKEAGIPLTDAPAKLRELAKLGWVERDRKSPDWWSITELGGRLAAASLLPPISVVRACELAHEVISAAEAVNHDPSFTRLVSRLVLFGSLVTTPAGGQVGDVDVAVEVVRRELDDDRHAALYAEELQTCPSGTLPYFWCMDRVIRRLRGRKVSLHWMQDFDAIKAPGVTVYRWDREAGRSQVTLPW
jgi:hypothetical protein